MLKFYFPIIFNFYGFFHVPRNGAIFGTLGFIILELPPFCSFAPFLGLEGPAFIKYLLPDAPAMLFKN